MSVDVNLSGIEQLTLDFGGSTTAVLTAPGNITITNTGSGGSSNHFVGTGSTPTIVPDTGAGIGATTTLVGTDAAGLFTVNSGTSGTSATSVCTVTFAVPYSTAPYVSIFPANINAAALANFTSFFATTSTTGFTFTAVTTGISELGNFEWYYVIIG